DVRLVLGMPDWAFWGVASPGCSACSSPRGSASASWPTTTSAATPTRGTAMADVPAPWWGLPGPISLWAQAGVPPASPYILIAFGAYMGGVFLLGALSHRLLKRGSFLKEYFLGDRKLNAWVLALTYVATSVSAGSFVGFPSLIYTEGWVLALWIAGYMVAGLVTKGVLAKRLNQVSRLSGAVTVPDVLRDRFRSPALGLLASACLLVMLSCNLVAQFKAGGLILRRAGEGVRDSAPYQAVRGATAAALSASGTWNEQEAAHKGSLA